MGLKRLAELIVAEAERLDREGSHEEARLLDLELRRILRKAGKKVTAQAQTAVGPAMQPYLQKANDAAYGYLNQNVPGYGQMAAGAQQVGQAAGQAVGRAAWAPYNAASGVMQNLNNTAYNYLNKNIPGYGQMAAGAQQMGQAAGQAVGQAAGQAVQNSPGMALVQAFQQLGGNVQAFVQQYGPQALQWIQQNAPHLMAGAASAGAAAAPAAAAGLIGGMRQSQ